MKSRSKFRPHAIVAALSVAFALSAEGAVYNGFLDPNSNGQVPAFNGFAVFSIPAGCETPGNHYTDNYFGSGSGCGFAFETAATIYVYGNTPLAPAGLPPGNGALDTLSLASPGDVYETYFGPGNQLLGIDTPPLLLTGNNGSGDPYHGTFWLDFDCQNCAPILAVALDGPRSAVVPTSLAYLLYDPRGGNDPTAARVSNPATVRFCNAAEPTCVATLAVPEPGILSLLAGALAFLAFGRRRRS